MKKIFSLLIILSLQVQSGENNYSGSLYQDVWDQIESDPYTSLPQNKISLSGIFNKVKTKIKTMAKRTIRDHSDILPYFEKLAHPNGVCLSGTWTISEDNPYSGYFKKGSEALIIARASTAMSETTVGNYRGFGMGGKLFPTNDPFHQTELKTANFFVIDDLGGTKARHYTDVELTNEPEVSKTSAIFRHLYYGIKVASAFSKADKNPGMRQVYQISHLGEKDPKTVITPRYMKIRAAKGQAVDEKDFRNELSISHYRNGLKFEILVGPDKKNWDNIGTIEFTDSVASKSCDHRLHFNHPKWKHNLKYK
jgi:hypothetical protein